MKRTMHGQAVVLKTLLATILKTILTFRGLSELWDPKKHKLSPGSVGLDTSMWFI